MGGGGLPIPMGKAGGGLGAILLVVIVALLFGGNVIGGGSDSGLSPGGFDPGPAAGSNAQPGDPEDTVFEFTKFVAKDTQDTWEKLFAQSGQAVPAGAGRDLLDGDAVGLRRRPRRRPGRSTARPTTRSTSTSRSSTSCHGASAHRATSPPRT